MPPLDAARPRVLALAIIRRDDRILVGESRDRVKNETFYRPLGGAVDFGERTVAALARELQEELGVTVERAELLGTIENIFTFEGDPGHEISLVYDVEIAEPLLEGRISVADTPDDAVWMPLSAFADGRPPLYPDGLYELLTTRTAAPRT